MTKKIYNPVNTNATKSAIKLLSYLYETAGNAIICGQHTQTRQCEEIQYIRDLTGKEPKLRGFELLAYSPNINYENASKACLDEVYDNQETVETALKWAEDNKGNAIVAMTFHWFSPVGGNDKSFYTEHTDFDVAKVLIDGTEERKAFYSDMDVIATQLKRFMDADIPVLWRPFHESDGTWFWWGAKGPEVAGELYKLMYDYYTNIHHLNNLLWVWNCPLEQGYPGDDYVDIASADVYLTEYMRTDYADVYKKIKENTKTDKIIALAEIGYLPDIEMLEKSQIPWAYYMTWSKEFCIGEQYNTMENLKKLYKSGYSIKL